ncbi:diguanylate cyclase/phosphodiesterase (GGDEF & EAL domains) with PAS/PAC sensor(s) [hydrothermal vent metagenome]|uniref:Diguanylate cyclase/phosphodiesterase (GGDEF & EAL domains) with PAS/PAC sensor(S) n=1 Tax=hydrothermal vent metagenome TaxID=652676 RepID=A0A3B1CE62_9ZZZZ
MSFRGEKVSPDSQAPPLRILLVEDSKHDRFAFREALARSDVEIVDCVRAEEALEKLHSNPGSFDLVVSDYKLPGISGLEFLRKLMDDKMDLPLILLTGSGSERIAVEASRVGVDDYIVKDPHGEYLNLLPTTLPLVAQKHRDRVARMKAEQALRESEIEYRSLFEYASDAIFIIAPDTRFILQANKVASAQLGYTNEELLSMRIDDINILASAEEHHAAIEKLKKMSSVIFETRSKRKNGELIDVEVSSRFIQYSGKMVIQSFVRNITERKRAEERLKLASNVFENIMEGVMVTDFNAMIEYTNPAFTKITGYTASEVIGKKPNLLKSKLHDKPFYRDMWRSLLTKGNWQGEIWNRRKDGESYPEWLTITAIRDEGGKTTQYAAIFHDITELKRGQEEIKYQAYHDALTGLPNRLLFHDRLLQAIGHARRNESELAILFLDLDNFKKINDGLGHEVGDLMLQGVATRLISSLREEDTVSRFGGDEFTIILENFDEAEDTSLVAQKIIKSLSEPFLYQGLKLFITTSIGITLFPEDGDSVEKLLKNADMAMYRAKEHGGNTYQFFTNEMNLKVIERFKIEDDLRKAVENEEFLIHYQPKVDLKTGSIISMEALARWQKPTGEIVSPAEFIPVAEETGLIIPIGEWVLREACVRTKAWCDKGYGPLKVTVNLSTKQFHDENLINSIKKVLDETGLDPRYLELEITESSMMADVDKNVLALQCLSSMGIRLAIDDFGTGYSSLSYLRRFPINTLKIDSSFVKEAPGDNDAESIVQVIIAMGHSLNLSVVAEGVETREQLEFLRKHKCDEMQGFYFSKPLPEARFEALLKKKETLS